MPASVADFHSSSDNEFDFTFDVDNAPRNR